MHETLWPECKHTHENNVKYLEKHTKQTLTSSICCLEEYFGLLALNETTDLNLILLPIQTILHVSCLWKCTAVY